MLGLLELSFQRLRNDKSTTDNIEQKLINLEIVWQVVNRKITAQYNAGYAGMGLRHWQPSSKQASNWVWCTVLMQKILVTSEDISSKRN